MQTTDVVEDFPDPRGRTMIEGFARVVSVEGGTAWLEPDQPQSCGGCKSSGMCGPGKSGLIKGRRFSMSNEHGFRVGERIVVGVGEETLLRASLVAYAMPLVVMLAAAMAAQLMTNSDAAAVGAAVVGLGAGLLLAKYGAGRLSARGDLSPKYLRHAHGGEDECSLD
ncbi:MAG: SoxR reducing system RseC family protein [Alphaproteobacteria bacterium]|nr:SoxR reducing system RseC family protein [Alphaproteobacteria bacterium]